MPAWSLVSRSCFGNRPRPNLSLQKNRSAAGNGDKDYPAADQNQSYGNGHSGEAPKRLLRLNGGVEMIAVA